GGLEWELPIRAVREERGREIHAGSSAPGHEPSELTALVHVRGRARLELPQQRAGRRNLLAVDRTRAYHGISAARAERLRNPVRWRDQRAPARESKPERARGRAPEC